MIDELLNERKKKTELENELETETKKPVEKGVKKRDESTRGRTQIFELFKTFAGFTVKMGSYQSTPIQEGKDKGNQQVSRREGRRENSIFKETNINQFHIDKIMSGF